MILVVLILKWCLYWGIVGPEPENVPVSSEIPPGHTATQNWAKSEYFWHCKFFLKMYFFSSLHMIEILFGKVKKLPRKTLENQILENTLSNFLAES